MVGESQTSQLAQVDLTEDPASLEFRVVSMGEEFNFRDFVLILLKDGSVALVPSPEEIRSRVEQLGSDSTSNTESRVKQEQELKVLLNYLAAVAHNFNSSDSDAKLFIEWSIGAIDTGAEKLDLSEIRERVKKLLDDIGAERNSYVTQYRKLLKEESLNRPANVSSSSQLETWRRYD